MCIRDRFFLLALHDIYFRDDAFYSFCLENSRPSLSLSLTKHADRAVEEDYDLLMWPLTDTWIMSDTSKTANIAARMLEPAPVCLWHFLLELGTLDPTFFVVLNTWASFCLGW